MINIQFKKTQNIVFQLTLSKEELYDIPKNIDLSTYIEDVYDCLQYDVYPIYHHILSKIVTRALIQNDLINKETAQTLIKFSAATKLQSQILDILCEEPQPPKSFENSLQNIIVKTDIAQNEIIHRNLTLFLSAIQGGTPSLLESESVQRLLKVKTPEKRIQIALSLLT